MIRALGTIIILLSLVCVIVIALTVLARPDFNVRWRIYLCDGRVTTFTGDCRPTDSGVICYPNAHDKPTVFPCATEFVKDD